METKTVIINTNGEALNMVNATIKSGVNFQKTVETIIDMFLTSRKFKYCKTEKIRFKKNKKRIKLVLNEQKYFKVKEVVESFYGECTHKEVINFLVVNYIKYN